VLWVHASTRDRFDEAYRDIAERLELPGRNDPKVDILRLVRNWLCDEANGKWAMVLDNADDIEMFYPKQTRAEDRMATGPIAAYLPQSRNGSILITSRSKDAAARLAGGYKNTGTSYRQRQMKKASLIFSVLSTIFLLPLLKLRHSSTGEVE
jgi:hypothetical protein